MKKILLGIFLGGLIFAFFAHAAMEGPPFIGVMSADLEMGDTPYSIDGGTNGLTFDPDNDNTNEATMDTSGGMALGGVTAVSGTTLLLPQTNDATTPTLAFGDGDTGLYESADDTLNISIAGTADFNFVADTFQSATAGGIAIADGIPTATSPVYSFRGDADTGIGRAGADQLSLVAGATELMRLDANSVDIKFSAAADQMQIDQTSTTGTEWSSGNPTGIIFINDDRTGATANEPEEATITIDAEGTYALSVLDGRTRFNDTVFLGDDVGLWLGLGIDLALMHDTNGTGDDLSLFNINATGGAPTSCLFISKDFNPNNMTDHDNYTSPTLVIANNGGADANDYAGVVLGERAQADVSTTHYFDFYAMTGAVDGSVDATTTEVGATFRFGDNPTTADNATGAGEVVFNDKVEFQDVLYLKEVSAPATPAANTAVLYLVDDGDGTQTLYVKFDDGTAVSLGAN